MRSSARAVASSRGARRFLVPFAVITQSTWIFAITVALSRLDLVPTSRVGVCTITGSEPELQLRTAMSLASEIRSIWITARYTGKLLSPPDLGQQKFVTTSFRAYHDTVEQISKSNRLCCPPAYRLLVN